MGGSPVPRENNLQFTYTIRTILLLALLPIQCCLANLLQSYIDPKNIPIDIFSGGGGLLSKKLWGDAD